MWKQINNISRYCGNHDLISPDHGKHPAESSGTLLMHLSESRARKNNVLFHKLQAAGISVVTESLFGFTKLILHHPRAVTAASRGSTIADLALRITHQPEPYILLSRFTHTLPCLTLISTIRALVCATAPPVRSPAKASAILNESVTAVTASRFTPVWYIYKFNRYIRLTQRRRSHCNDVTWALFVGVGVGEEGGVGGWGLGWGGGHQRSPVMRKIRHFYDTIIRN